MDHSCSSSSVLDSGGLEVLGSTKQSRDPPAQCHGAQTDPPVPALRFCGQLAQWTGNSTNYQGDVGINSTIFFGASPGEAASSRLELRNEGNTSIFYSWQQLDVSSSLSHLLSHRRRSCFYFNQSSGVILPRVTQQIDLMFKSGVPGLHTESWQLQTNPVLLQGASVQVTLMGFAVSEDRTAELRRHLETRLEKTVTEKFCRSMVYKILEGVQTRERSSSLVEFLMGSPEEERERQESGEMDPADQSLGRDFAHDQTFTDFTPFEEEAYSAAFGSFSGSTSPK
ncbi:MYCBP-associated protein-like isoform X1 [Takifugu rubripes]|uniref:MYCBP-associated protein-like isoform X1 n=1 Tax=Takifugu rubripes TaxID=31033 RepID=UPI0011455792|nr:MYCBP-associated protein isoform X1 [Takifugu rubripes]